MSNSFRRRSDGGYTTLQTEQPFKVPDNKILQSATFTPQLSTVEYTPGSSENYPSGYTKLAVEGSSSDREIGCSFGFSATTNVSSASYSLYFEQYNTERVVDVSVMTSGYISFRIIDSLNSRKGFSIYKIEFQK